MDSFKSDLMRNAYTDPKNILLPNALACTTSIGVICPCRNGWCEVKCPPDLYTIVGVVSIAVVADQSDHPPLSHLTSSSVVGSSSRLLDPLYRNLNFYSPSALAAESSRPLRLKMRSKLEFNGAAERQPPACPNPRTYPWWLPVPGLYPRGSSDTRSPLHGFNSLT